MSITDPKYYDHIRKSRKAVGAADGATQPDNLPPFDLQRLRSKGIGPKIVGWLFEKPDWWLGFNRRFWPRARIGRFLLLTKTSDVREVLERQEDFETPYAMEMQEFAGGANFILGMADGETYRRQKSVVLTAFPPMEISARVRTLAASHTQAIVDGAGPRLNVAWDLIRPVSIKLARDYYGLAIAEHEESDFADWNLALSQIFFGDPTADKVTRELAIVASYRVREVIGRSLVLAAKDHPNGDRPMDRLARMIREGKTTRDEAISITMGMTTGFAPTVLLAVGNCIDVALSKPEAYAAIEAAIRNEDNEALDKAIRETMRFKPIWVAPWRYAAQEHTIGASSGKSNTGPNAGQDKPTGQAPGKPYSIKADTVIWPATRAAMFDPNVVKDPWTFNPDRSPKDSMIFGHGIHMCIGQALALTQGAETFRALFSRGQFRRAPGREGKLSRLGAYPEKLIIEFGDQAGQKMITLAAPVRKGVKAQEVRDALKQLGDMRSDPDAENIEGRPVQQRVQAQVLSAEAIEASKVGRKALDAERIIHFASVIVVSSSHIGGTDDDCHVIVEITGDGAEEQITKAFDRAVGDQIKPVLEQYLQRKPGQDALEAMKEYKAPLRFGKLKSLAFFGTPGHTVKRIIQEDELANAAMKEVEKKLSTKPKNGERRLPGDILCEVRKTLFSQHKFAWATTPVDNGLEGPEGNVRTAIHRTLSRPIKLGLVVLFILSGLASHFFHYPAPDNIWEGTFRVGATFVKTLLGLATIFVLISAATIWWFRRKENAVELRQAAISRQQLAELQSFEDQPNYVQNHLASVSVLHPGPLRWLALRLTFYLIAISAAKVFRPGRLASIGSIHFARWLVVPNTKLLIFCSNYGGSWESYLEDFITKASKGITGVWSNAVGFPRTRFLFLDGAEHGDRFKRWARTQQVPTSFWYSAYPTLTTTHIRRNALIRAGLCSGIASDGREWIRLFASQAASPVTYQPRFAAPKRVPVDPIETGEIQALGFGPLGRLPWSRMLAFRLDGDKAQRKAWLSFISGKVVFGESTLYRKATFLALTASGVQSAGLPPSDASFPLAFVQGMADANRSRILDDVDASDPCCWRWGSHEHPVDAVVLCYAATIRELKKLTKEIEEKSAEFGIELVHALDMAVKRDTKGKHRAGQKREAREHFGFVDGISQPVIRGARRKTGADQHFQHLVNPGEFFLGYRDEHGFYPPSPVVEPQKDPTGILTSINTDGEPVRNGAYRDFGRNGSFMVIRQLEQHVAEFNDYCERTAQNLREISGKEITEEWVGAKIVGRWQNGSSLTRNPEKAGTYRDNSFTYGAEDRQGLGCPLGAHVRRSNPRDSLDTDSDLQIRIGKRHRILRVGRTYTIPASSESKKELGLLFMCLNANIERQYEFVQQTWMSSASFHGLRNEKDPLIGRQPTCPAGAGPNGRFTAPNWDGANVMPGIPSFVTTRGGGYYFLPGRAALAYLVSIAPQ